MVDADGAGARRRARLADARLYLCTPLRAAFRPYLDAVLRPSGGAGPGVDGAAGGRPAGVDIVQVRHKGLEWRQEAEALAVATAAGAAAGALVSANDRADLAAATGVDVLHVGQDDIPPATARRFVGPDVLIGKSTHDPAQLEAALADPDVDYFCVGPVWATPTKEGRPPVGLDLPRLAARLAPPFAAGSKPWFVTGGVGDDTLDEVLATGARRVVVVRGITGASDPGAAATAVASRLRSA